jgi:hypothetical protein
VPEVRVRDIVPRATFTALRARRQAYQIATDILYEAPIDVSTVACSGCGEWIEVGGSAVTDPLICPRCSKTTPLPAYLRAKHLARREPMPPMPLDYCPSDEGLAKVNLPEISVPRWLIWFTVILIPIWFGVVVGLLAWGSK